MKRVLPTILFLFLISFNSFASFDLFAAKKIVIKGSNCSSLMEQAEAVLAWSHKLGEHLNKKLPQCMVSGSGYSIDLYSISPKNVQTYNEVYPEASGPNCWNRALVFANILPKLSYTTPEEMTFWMDSALCQERGIDEEPQPGDIIAVRVRNADEVHGFTYLNEDLAFSKNGYSNHSNYAYQSLESVFNIYGVPAECQRVTSDSPLSNICYRRGWATYYNCQSLEEYLDQVAYRPDREAEKVAKALNKLDRDVFKHVFKGFTIILVSKDKLDNRLKTLKGRILKKLKDELPEDDQLFWRGMLQRVYALEIQISLI